MIKLVTQEELVEILTIHEGQQCNIKTITGKDIAEYKLKDVIYIGKDERIILNGEGDDGGFKNFKIPLENIKQICIDDGIDFITKKNYILATITYSVTKYICLHINF